MALLYLSKTSEVSDIDKNETKNFGKKYAHLIWRDRCGASIGIFFIFASSVTRFGQICHLGKQFRSLWQFLIAHLVFGKLFNLLWYIFGYWANPRLWQFLISYLVFGKLFYLLWYIFGYLANPHCCAWPKYWTNNVAIWSHCSPLEMWHLLIRRRRRQDSSSLIVTSNPCDKSTSKRIWWSSSLSKIRGRRRGK